MLAIVRRETIIEIIKREKKVIVQKLAEEFSVTEETIRRDLEKLEEQDILKRTYGGAVLNEGTNTDIPISIRESMHMEEKIKIANSVAKDINDGETLMLDSSSTAFYVARALNVQNKKVTIITNSLKIVSEVQDSKNIKCIVTGGIFNNSRKSIVGKWTEVLISNYYVNKAIVCCKGIDLKRGVTDSNEEEAAIKIAMCKSASEVWLLVDSNKFDKASFVKIMDFDIVNKIYTDKIISTQWKEILEHSMIETIIC